MGKGNGELARFHEILMSNKEKWCMPPFSGDGVVNYFFFLNSENIIQCFGVV